MRPLSDHSRGETGPVCTDPVSTDPAAEPQPPRRAVRPSAARPAP